MRIKIALPLLVTILGCESSLPNGEPSNATELSSSIELSGNQLTWVKECMVHMTASAWTASTSPQVVTRLSMQYCTDASKLLWNNN